MKSLTKELWFKTEKRVEFINITDQVQDAVLESGIREGLVLINPMHITAAVYVNDNESGLIQDYEDMLKRLVPEHPKKGDYKHNATGEDNAYAHMWRQLMGHQIVMAITRGKLHLGLWERIFYAEFDGKRRKRVLIKVIGE